jgi:transposase
LKFLDEAGCHKAMTRPYGWAKRGEPCKESVVYNRGVNQTMLGVLGMEGMLACQSVSGSVKKEQVVAFFVDHLVPVLQAGDIVVLDNARSHVRALLSPLVEAAGCSLLYLPPYSPDFSPIELAWRPIKAGLKAAGHRVWSTLRPAMLAGMQAVTREQAVSYFRHCRYKVEQP